MSYRDRLAKAVAVITLFFAGALALWACGPSFPHWLLTSEAGILEAPTVWLRDALQPLPAEKPPFPVVQDEKGPLHQTAAADLKDLETALAALPAARRQAVIEPYVKVRDAITAWREQVVAWREEAQFADPKPPRPAPPELAVPSGLPGEFEDYLRGAIAYHLEQPDAARAAWEKLLARPEKERRLRSTWAAFMLGKAAIEKDPAAAVHGFERTRELASKGFPDPLGLAQASLGWQARAEMGRGRPEETLKLYLQQEKGGDPTALPSIRRVCARMVDDADALKKVARSPEARAVFTAWALSVWTRQDYEGPLEAEGTKKWLAALRAAGVSKTDGADRLAWAAYRSGDFAAAGEWLKQAPADAPMARWIRAKLLLRAGKLAEAEPLLTQAAAALPAAPTAGSDLWGVYEEDVQPALRPRANGELGAVRLARGEYAAALDALLRGGYWMDAAYVGERVLTVDELRAYIDKTWPADLAARYRPGEGGVGWELLQAGLAPPPDERVAYDVRYLLGRRLAQAGRFEEARAYFPAPLQVPLDDLRQSFAKGRDESHPAAERARSLFRAACLTRHQGMELLGIELEPDWQIWGGSYEPDPFAVARADGKTHQHLGPSKDESARVARSRVEPTKRFHYRYQGAALARSAAALLPGGEEKARILASAGTWLKARDPEAAQPFYQAILACCGDTDLGRKARRLKAVPTADACEGDTKATREEGT
ncbi:MAG TPA: hypothetical protein VF173_39030 [Thermoanaerobaculia bacterium]|nr:hypothetical protein [Thermoanaerobaculia bacterium]